MVDTHKDLRWSWTHVKNKENSVLHTLSNAKISVNGYKIEKLWGKNKMDYGGKKRIP